MSRRYFLLLFMLAFGFIAGTGPESRADLIIYQTGFESPEFSTGFIDNQSEWFSPIGPNSTRITTSLPQTGAQGFQIFGSDLETPAADPTQAVGFARRVFNYDASGTPRVRIQVDARLQGPSTNNGNGIADDIISINLEAQTDEFDYLGGITLSSNGNAYVFGSLEADSFLFETPISLDEWYTLGLDIDFANRQTEFLLNDTSLGVLAFDPAITSNVLRTGSLAMVLSDPTFDASPFIGAFDNYAITAVPEPAGLAILGIGIGLALQFRRQRKTPPRPVNRG